MLPVLRDRIQEIERSSMKNARYFQMAHGSEKCFQIKLRKRTNLQSFLWKVSVEIFQWERLKRLAKVRTLKRKPQVTTRNLRQIEEAKFTKIEQPSQANGKAHGCTLQVQQTPGHSISSPLKSLKLGSSISKSSLGAREQGLVWPMNLSQ